MKTAQVLVIGDEILSGRTQDTNSSFLSKKLYEKGIRTIQVVTLPDQLNIVSSWISMNHSLADYLFVCGGIGGTPDDITREAVARAMGVPMERSAPAEALLRQYYKDKINDERLRMSDLPRGCELISNSVTMAPGLRIGNIYVFAGIPRIMHAMFEAIEPSLVGGKIMHEKDIKLQVGEGEIAAHMRLLLGEFPKLELGSYPRVSPDQDYRTHLIFKSLEKETVEKAFDRFKILMNL